VLVAEGHRFEREDCFARLVHWVDRLLKTHRTELGLSKYAAEAAEEAALHQDKLGIAGKVKDVSDIHKNIWPPEPNQSNILQIGFLIGTTPGGDQRSLNSP
jgi:hypothetical protein